MIVLLLLIINGDSKIGLKNLFTYVKSKGLIFIKVIMLKEVLKAKGVKQKWLAEKMGVSVVTVSNWVTKKSSPSRKNLERLSNLLDVSIYELI